MAKPLIQIQDLWKIFEGDGVETVALHDVNLTIDQGEFVAIMGPSGSGKSTLLHILGFLDRPTKGRYLFNGENVEEFTDDELAYLRNEKVGFIFQKFNLLKRTSVFENVKLPLYYSDIPEKKWKGMVEHAIESVGLTHRMYHESAQLSGGEQQRVAIARAILNDPDVIFADEPTGNLDTKSGGQVMEIIQDLNEKGRTVILITHETYTSHYAERIIRLLDGEIDREERNGVHRLKKGEFKK